MPTLIPNSRSHNMFTVNESLHIVHINILRVFRHDMLKLLFYELKGLCNQKFLWLMLLITYHFQSHKRLISTNIPRQIVIVGIRYINWTIGYFFNDCYFSFECSSCHHTSKFCLSSWVCSTIGWTLDDDIHIAHNISYYEYCITKTL